MICGCRLHQDVRLRGGHDRCIGQILDGNRLAAGRLEGGHEVVDAGVGSREHVVGRQHRLRVAAREMDHVGEAGGLVAIAILSGDPEAAGHSNRWLKGEASDGQLEWRPWADVNPRLSPENTGVRSIASRD